MSDPLDYTLDELLASIEEITAPQIEDGFYTPSEWADIWGKNVGTARRAIVKLLAAGRMEHGSRLETSPIDGRVRRKDTFKLCDKN
jgi:hypothetical protein